MQHRRWSLWNPSLRRFGCALGLALVWHPTLASTSPLPTATPFPPAEKADLAPLPPDQARAVFAQISPESVLRDLYERFAEATRASGDEISIRVFDVETTGREQFDKIPLHDPGRAVLQPEILLTTQRSWGTNPPTETLVSFQSEWEESFQRPSPQHQALVEATRELSLAEGIALARMEAEGSELYAGVVAITRYTVTVWFQGRTETSRAGVSWRALDAETVVFGTDDPVIHNLTSTYQVEHRIVPWRDHRLEPGRTAGRAEPKAASSQDQAEGPPR